MIVLNLVTDFLINFPGDLQSRHPVCRLRDWAPLRVLVANSGLVCVIFCSFNPNPNPCPKPPSITNITNGCGRQDQTLSIVLFITLTMRRSLH